MADEKITKPALMARCKPVKPRNKLAITPAINTKPPTSKNLPIKSKSFLVISAKADKPKKTKAVMESAETTTSPIPAPRYMLKIGPSDKPIKPVKQKQ